ncbi:olfactory receptor 6C74-like [Pseudophryne corroboree]|uniref:olfactory receptor 6C74-like n=1 Tax=Pseudophryne corroboree TaxID=495146 RepID=UPI003081F23D
MTHGTDLGNVTGITYFVLTGVSDVPKVRVAVFLFVLITYVITLGGNVTIMSLILLDYVLHTPMYFFLSNLSCLDILYTSITLNRILFSYVSGDKTIAFSDCMVNLYCFMSLAGSEILILTAMSYDRYVAICNPLHYQMFMSRRVCIMLSALCWGLGFLEMSPFTYMVYRFSCYTSNVINHFFCDIMALVKLSCSDTSLLEKSLLIVAAEGAIIPFLLIIISYINIIHAILKISSATGSRKAFYTCSSHLTVVSLYFATACSLYLRPPSMITLDSDKLISLVYTAVVPMLNPLIYSLKNKEVKVALSNLFKHSIVL